MEIRPHLEKTNINIPCFYDFQPSDNKKKNQKKK